MNETARRRDADGPPSPSLWFGWFGGPIAFLFQLIVVYAATSHACRGLGRGLLFGITVACLVIALAAAVVAWRDVFAIDRIHPPRGPMETLHRMRFMSQVGAMTGTLFSFVLIAQWIVVGSLDPCPW